MIKPRIGSLQKKKFKEEQAKLILTYCFPNRYQSAELSESPDIVVPGLSIGIEVTECVHQGLQQNMSRAHNITGKTHKELSEIDKKNVMEQHVFVHELPNGTLIAGFTSWGNQHDLMASYSKKLKKLNEHHFKHYKENNLFIFAWLIDEDELTKGISEIINSLNLPIEHKYSFDNIYIYKETSLVHICVKNQSVNYLHVPHEVMTNISEESFLKIMGMTRDEYYSH